MFSALPRVFGINDAACAGTSTFDKLVGSSASEKIESYSEGEMAALCLVGSLLGLASLSMVPWDMPASPGTSNDTLGPTRGDDGGTCSECGPESGGFQTIDVNSAKTDNSTLTSRHISYFLLEERSIYYKDSDGVEITHTCVGKGTSLLSRSKSSSSIASAFESFFPILSIMWCYRSRCKSATGHS